MQAYGTVKRFIKETDKSVSSSWSLSLLSSSSSSSPSSSLAAAQFYGKMESIKYVMHTTVRCLATTIHIADVPCPILPWWPSILTGFHGFS
jgi:hypothetical protein